MSCTPLNSRSISPDCFEQIAHEQEERHRGEGGVAHHREELQHHQVQDDAAEREIAEDQRNRDQGEGDREADEDRGEQGGQRDEAKQLGAHSHSPWRAAHTLLRNSEAPWISSSATASGMTNLNG